MNGPMSQDFQHRVHVRKESLKFASAHMTVFSDGTKEALHGHNYTTEVWFDLRRISIREMVPFSTFKDAIRQICMQWDEKVLLAEKCPFFEILKQSDREIEFLLSKKRYVLPGDEVVLLPLDNITAETLSDEFCRRLVAQFSTQPFFQLIARLYVRVDESPGQGATSIYEN